MTRHPHAEIIHAWAEGAEIEWYDREHEGWVVVPNPSWYAHHQYRVKYKKPEPDQSAHIASLEADLLHLTTELHNTRQQIAALQAKREPLSDDEIQDIHNEQPSRSTYYEFARAIEAAHDIGVTE